jgi:hypothetical protein
MSEECCHCGLPLHYSCQETRAFVEAMIAELGPLIDVTIKGRTWRVPRHYIALHRLHAADVARLGFEEVIE